jgi:hypothetical protein
MALFSSPHLLLRSAVKEGSEFHWSVAVQTANRAAAGGGGVLIRKMRPFEESHAPPN